MSKKSPHPQRKRLLHLSKKKSKINSLKSISASLSSKSKALINKKRESKLQKSPSKTPTNKLIRLESVTPITPSVASSDEAQQKSAEFLSSVILRGDLYALNKNYELQCNKVHNQFQELRNELTTILLKREKNFISDLTNFNDECRAIIEKNVSKMKNVSTGKAEKKKNKKGPRGSKYIPGDVIYKSNVTDDKLKMKISTSQTDHLPVQSDCSDVSAQSWTQ